MNPELKQLIEDAAKLLGYEVENVFSDGYCYYFNPNTGTSGNYFSPLDPDRGDLMKVAEAAELVLNFNECYVHYPRRADDWHYYKDDHDSKALAILRAASAVWRARGGE